MVSVARARVRVVAALEADSAAAVVVGHGVVRVAAVGSVVVAGLVDSDRRCER